MKHLINKCGKHRVQLKDKLADAGLRPGPNDYPALDDREFTETLTDLSTEYLE